jgi:3-oxoacyl-[acyl-carrier protein] reductase
MSAMSPQRTAMVMGGSGGIGRAVAQRLASDGFAVAVHYAASSARAQNVVADIVTHGGRAIAVGGDVADENAMAAAFDRVESELGGVDVVVNTAGVMLLGTVEDFPLDDFDRIVRTNLRGTFVVAQQSAKRVRRGGAIINFSTSVTRTQFPAYGPYVATKAAVESLSLILARELRGRDITVNAVAPGPTATSLFLEGKTAEAIDGLAHAAPLERLGEPADIAETVAFLAGPARWVNGQTVFANGGLA